MIETLASVFGMSVDDTLKLMIGLGALVTTVLGALGKFMRNLHGARRRSFVKIRRLEDIIEQMAIGDKRPWELITQMKADQRDNSDLKDADD